MLRTAILKFAEAHPNAVRDVARGNRVITQGAISDECYLIKNGTVSILVGHSSTREETQVALRFEGDLIGETAFLQRNVPRTASVEVVSPKATLICLARKDIFALLRHDPSLHDAITLLWELASSRREEILQVMDGHISVENRVMSVLLADIHNFSALGEGVWEEQSNAFLFDFIEQAQDSANRCEASFEDQGDGFRVLFRQQGHASRSLIYAMTVRDSFLRLRAAWFQRNDAFGNIGLGVGICTDCISIRRREGSLRTEGRVLSHAINVAASISKLRTVPSDVDVYLDDNTYSMLEPVNFDITGPHQKWLEKLGRIYSIYCVRPFSISVSESSRLHDKDNIPTKSIAVNGREADEQRPISILFLASDPTDAVRLRLAEEAREIQHKLQLSKYRDKFTFHQRGAVRPEDLSQALLDLEPKIVHFSGHGTSAGELCFEDRIGKTHAIPSSSLADLFREFSQTVKCVVLNACFSEVQALAIGRHIDYVIGMDKAISDGAALAFSVGLYQAIGAGKTIKEAYRLGCVQVGLQGVDGDEKLTPILKVRTDSASP